MVDRLEQPQCLGQIRGWLCFVFVLLKLLEHRCKRLSLRHQRPHRPRLFGEVCNGIVRKGVTASLRVHVGWQLPGK